MTDKVYDGHGELVKVPNDVVASVMSFIEDHEMVDAHAVIDKQFVQMTGKPFDARVAGFMIAVKLFVADEKTAGGILLTDKTRDDSRYSSVAGLVVGMGPQAYKGNNPDGTPRYPEGPWCRVGDWVLLPRYEATLMTFRGVSMGMIADDRIQLVIADPTDVQAFATSAKF